MKKVLVVDDSKTIRQQVSFTLNKAGFVVLEAEDGVSGFNYLEADSEIQMVISDVNMPGGNGLDMLEKIKSYGDKYSKIPIVMLTTEGKSELVQRAKESGAKGWLVKPFEPKKLVDTVNHFIGK